MKNFSDFLNEAKKKIDIQDETINYIDAANLKKYLDIADKFITDDTKFVINWLIDNNASYISELSKGGDNALADFYDGGVPKKNELRPLYKALGNLYKTGKLMQVPVFQTKEQFDSILNKEESVDKIALDLVSSTGKNQVAQQYTPLVHKIALQWYGKSALSNDDVLSAAFEGLAHAINTYGKRGTKAKASDSAIASYTFGQYAAYIIRTSILEAVKNESRIVRVPVSAQNKERKEIGRNIKNNTVYGDEKVSNGSSRQEGNSKSYFDKIGGTNDVTNNLDDQDAEKIWNRIRQKIEDKFDKKTLDIYYSSTGIFDYPKLKNKEIAKKYNVAPSNITYYCFKVNNYMLHDPELKDALKLAYELMRECANEKDQEDEVNEIMHFVNNM